MWNKVGIVRLRQGLTFPQSRVPAQHVQHQKIQVPVPVDVREIHAHRVFAGVAQGQPGQRPKHPLAIVDPDPVRRPIVIAHIEVGETVAVNVAKCRAQSPVQRLRRQRLS